MPRKRRKNTNAPCLFNEKCWKKWLKRKTAPSKKWLVAKKPNAKSELNEPGSELRRFDFCFFNKLPSLLLVELLRVKCLGSTGLCVEQVERQRQRKLIRAEQARQETLMNLQAKQQRVASVKEQQKREARLRTKTQAEQVRAGHWEAPFVFALWTKSFHLPSETMF